MAAAKHGSRPGNPMTTPKKPTAAKPPAAPRKKPAPPKKAPPSTGPLGPILVDKLKRAPTGASDSAIIMETLRSVPVEQLKDDLTKAPPKARNQLFSAIPADQIKSIVGSLSPSVLAPAAPPAPPRSPRGGPPATILQTSYENVPYPPAQSDPDWAQKISGGSTIGITSPPPWEWVSVYEHTREKEGSLNNPAVGLTGWVVAEDPPLSSADIWFVHPFGFDFEFFIAPDPQYESLLGAHNTGRDAAGKTIDPGYDRATQRAQQVLGLPATKGVLGVETDQDLVPPSFRDRVVDGARIATFGRWIVDCGHDDFHTEIHPPLLMAVATPTPPPRFLVGASEMTHVEIMSRPYTVSQKWDEGNFVDHLLAEVGKVETTIFGIPLSTRVEAHPTVFTTPYEGRPFIKLLVKPPVPRPHLGVTPQRLTVNFHFTHRTGVAVQVFDAGSDTVGIIIVLGDLNPAKLPPKHDLTVQWSELGKEYSWVIDALEIADLLTLDIASAIILDRGILTDRYDAPSASSPLDNQNVAASVGIDQLQAGVGFSEDDNQPFPIYGWMNMFWQETGVVVGPPLP
jgi:hypothetical protein